MLAVPSPLQKKLQRLTRLLLGPQLEPPTGAEPPEGVHIHWPDGHTEEMPTIYLGVDREGMHHWEGIARPRDGHNHFHLTVDRMPGHTVLEFTLHTATDLTG